MKKVLGKKIKPVIIGIGGRSCSGKSTVVKKIEEKYNREFLCINQDSFFKINAPNNWENPDSLRFDKLINSIKDLKNGKKTYIPNHRCTEVFDREVKPHKIIIVEGFLLFINKKLNKLFDKKIWVDVSDLNILYRRLKRSNNLKKIDYIMSVIIPESKKYEYQQKKEADIIIDGNKSEEDIAICVEKQIKKY